MRDSLGLFFFSVKQKTSFHPLTQEKVPAIAQEMYVYVCRTWRALAFLGKLQKDGAEKYGFRSRNCPPVVNESTDFENDMQLMIKNISFKRANNPFQTQLKNDIDNIKSSNKIFVPAENRATFTNWRKIITTNF